MRYKFSPPLTHIIQYCDFSSASPWVILSWKSYFSHIEILPVDTSSSNILQSSKRIYQKKKSSYLRMLYYIRPFLPFSMPLCFFTFLPLCLDLDQGITYPATHSMFGIWAPQYEKSYLVVLAYAGQFTDLTY